MSYILYFLIYIILLLLIIFISKKLKLYDCPGERKIHKNKVLNTSGLALYIFLFLIVSTHEFHYQIEEIILFGSLVTLCGFFDDQKNLNPGVKLILILLPTGYLIINGYMIKDLGQYNILGIIHLGKFSLIFTLLACGLLINSYNYIDGSDGLLLATVLINLIYAIFLIANPNAINILLIFLIPVFINFVFNLLPGQNSYKIFSGDGGSLFLGFFVSFLIIVLYKIENIHPAYLIWICWYPVYDFLYVTIYRLINNKKFYTPDNIHLHHLIMDYTEKSQYVTLVLVSTINISITITGYLVTKFFGEIYSLAYFFSFFWVYFYINLSLRKNLNKNLMEKNK